MLPKQRSYGTGKSANWHRKNAEGVVEKWCNLKLVFQEVEKSPARGMDGLF